MWYYIKNQTVVGIEGKAIRGRGKIKEYIRHRPSDKMIHIITEECKDFWPAMIDECPEVKNMDASLEKYRNSNGGHLFFRPISIVPFAKALGLV